MISAEFEILKLAVRADEEAASRAAALAGSGEIDWDDLYERADLHGVKPQLAKLTGKLPPAVIPESFRERMREAGHANVFLQLRLLAEFLDIRKMLEENGITAIPFKGFWLAHKYYGNLADREAVDVDLLIDFNDLDKTGALMKTRDYIPEVQSSPVLYKKLKKESAEYNFDRTGENGERYHFEFHWKIGSTSHRMDIGLAELMPQVIEGVVQNHRIKIFTSRAGFLLAMMHHGGKDPLVQLKHILDTALMITDPAMDWEWVMRMARRYGIEKLIYVAAALAEELVGTAIPEVIKEAADRPAIRKLAAGRIQAMSLPPERWYDDRFEADSLMFHLRSRTGFRVKARIITDGLKGRVIKLLVPRRVISFYLKKRYSLNR